MIFLDSTLCVDGDFLFSEIAKSIFSHLNELEPAVYFRLSDLIHNFFLLKMFSDKINIWVKHLIKIQCRYW